MHADVEIWSPVVSSLSVAIELRIRRVVYGIVALA